MKMSSEIAFGRTPTGQCVYDVCFSRLSAKEVVRRYPHLTREFVLEMRRKNPNLRPGKRKRRRRGEAKGGV